jgi:hypothetical protein
MIKAPTEDTYSPYANSNSPQMNPYIQMYNPFLVPIPFTYAKKPMYGHGLYYGGNVGGCGLF